VLTLLDAIITILDGFLLHTLQKILPACDAATMVTDRVTGKTYGPFPEYVDGATGAPVEVVIRGGKLEWPSGAVTILLTKRERAEFAVARATRNTESIRYYLGFARNRVVTWHKEQTLGGVNPPWVPL